MSKQRVIACPRHRVESARRSVADAQARLDEEEAALAEAERAAEEEARERRRARRDRLSEQELSDIESMAQPRATAPLLFFAVDELRDMVLGYHDRNVLERVRGRLSGYERDLIERLLEMTAPRSVS